jgi:hypothetical protein
VREGTPLPVRAPRWALFRALVILVHAAKRSTHTVQGRGGSPLRVVGDSSAVSVRVTTPVGPSPSLLALAQRCGGECSRDDDELVLTLPSILELRRRERAGNGRDDE